MIARYGLGNKWEATKRQRVISKEGAWSGARDAADTCVRGIAKRRPQLPRSDIHQFDPLPTRVGAMLIGLSAKNRDSAIVLFARNARMGVRVPRKTLIGCSLVPELKCCLRFFRVQVENEVVLCSGMVAGD
jgi:hypothetical protein